MIYFSFCFCALVIAKYINTTLSFIPQPHTLSFIKNEKKNSYFETLNIFNIPFMYRCSLNDTL